MRADALTEGSQSVLHGWGVKFSLRRGGDREATAALVRSSKHLEVNLRETVDLPATRRSMRSEVIRQHLGRDGHDHDNARDGKTS